MSCAATARRYMKGERRDNTLQTTALVHEVYLRVSSSMSPKWEWQQRAQFFAIAAQTCGAFWWTPPAPALRTNAVVARCMKISDETAIVSPQPDCSMVALDDALTFAEIASAPGQSGGAALFRRPAGRRNRRGPPHLPPHRPPRLGLCPSLASQGTVLILVPLHRDFLAFRDGTGL